MLRKGKTERYSLVSQQDRKKNRKGLDAATMV